jgi:hypothetical protein
MIDGTLHEYQQYEDIPAQFDHVIEFIPEYPLGPHTDAEHEELDQWDSRLQRLMEIERASSSKKR